MYSSRDVLLQTVPLWLLGAMTSNLSTGVVPGAQRAPQQTTPRCQVRGSPQWLASRASPLDSATLLIGTRVAKICYSRPSARGRSVYDSLAPFGKAWRTGANEPTILELSDSADVAGVALAPGRYVLLTVPRPAQWVVLFHTFAASDDPARIFQTLVEVGHGTAQATTLPAPVETFVIRATQEPSGAAFLLEWGPLRARLPVAFRR